MTNRRLLLILVLVSCSITTLLQGQTAMPSEILRAGRPIAIDGMADNSYYVLTADGVVFRYTDGPRGMQYSTRFELPGVTQSADLAFFSRAGSEAVFVTAWSDSMRTGLIFRFSPEGKLVQTWRETSRVSGIGVDLSNNMVYYSTYDTNNISRINLATGSEEYICELQGSEGAGAVVVDSVQRRVYAADPSGGKIFQIDLQSRKPTILAQWKGSPSALRIDAAKQLLYITDSLNGSVWRLDLRRTNPVPEVVFQFRGKTEILGIALGRNNTLLIADSREGRVYSVQATPQTKSVQALPQAKSEQAAPQSNVVQTPPQSKSRQAAPQSKSKQAPPQAKSVQAPP